jgi:hypothetical protein
MDNRRSRTRQKPRQTDNGKKAAFELQLTKEAPTDTKSRLHVLNNGIVCDTEPRGYESPGGRSPTELVLDASEGFIPLWAKGTSLRWRFRESSLSNFANPASVKAEVRGLFADALMAWGDAAPVSFTENDDLWDFEIVVRSGDNCSPSGCVLASAFFPDPGRHELEIYPKMFTQSRKEQVDTLIHESGHIFGLRHFFAQISETEWPSEIFGTHSKFTIMNYGALSELTDTDRDDLRKLYQLVWSGSLTQINGTPIRLVKPYHTLISSTDNLVSPSVQGFSQVPGRLPWGSLMQFISSAVRLDGTNGER